MGVRRPQAHPRSHRRRVPLHRLLPRLPPCSRCSASPHSCNDHEDNYHRRGPLFRLFLCCAPPVLVVNNDINTTSMHAYQTSTLSSRASLASVLTQEGAPVGTSSLGRESTIRRLPPAPHTSQHACLHVATIVVLHVVFDVVDARL